MTEAKFAAVIMVAQDMLQMYHLLESLKLEVKLPMLLKIGCSEAADIVNSWSTGDRTHHVDEYNNFLQELKDHRLFTIRHISGDENDIDIFTKNVMLTVFDCCLPLYVGIDEYVTVQVQALSREAVRRRFLTETCNRVSIEYTHHFL